MERNNFLEMDGLAYESDTHEWFFDNSTSNYAQRENKNGVALKNLTCYVVRQKDNGEYDRVVMDNIKQELIYDSKSLEEICFFIDRIKIAKHFKVI